MEKMPKSGILMTDRESLQNTQTLVKRIILHEVFPWTLKSLLRTKSIQRFPFKTMYF